MRRLLLLVGFFLAGMANMQKASATHVMGADLEYNCVGKDSFEIIIKVYKDCKGVSLSPIALSVAGIGCSFSGSYSMTQVSCTDITPVCKKSCSKCSPTNCNAYGYPNGSNASCSFQYGIEKLVFKQLVVFKNTSCCKMRLSYSQCCRNSAITTCCADENFFSFAEMDRCLTPCNSSPVLANDPVAIFCVGQCICINNGARDTVDFDSISYHLSPAYTAYGSKVSYNGSYHEKEPLYYDGFPKKPKPPTPNPSCKGFVLDSITGDLCFKPMQQQVAVLAMEIKEWRKNTAGKMVNIGVTRRDMQVIILNSCTNKPPQIRGPYSVVTCAGEQVCFGPWMQTVDPDSQCTTGKPCDTVRVRWNQSIPKAVFTKTFESGRRAESWQLCWTPQEKDASTTPYFFTITATDDACPLAGTASRSFSILVKRTPYDTTKYTNIGCGKWRLQADLFTNKKYTAPKFKWVVPYPGGTVYWAKDTVHQFPKGGYYAVQHTIEDNGCASVKIDTIYVPPFVYTAIDPDTFICKGQSYTISSATKDGTTPYRYRWITGNSNDTLTTLTVSPSQDTTYVLEVQDKDGCFSYDTMNLFVKPLPIINDLPKQRVCEGDSMTFDAGDNQGAANVAAWLWTDASNNSVLGTGQTLTVSDSLTIAISMIDTFGCKSEDTTFSFINKKVIVDAGPDQVVCVGDSAYLEGKIVQASGEAIYEWVNLTSGNVETFGTKFGIKPTATNSYVFHANVTWDSVICHAYDTVTITVENPAVLQLRKTPNKDFCEGVNGQYGLQLVKAVNPVTNADITNAGTTVWTISPDSFASALSGNTVTTTNLPATYKWGQTPSSYIYAVCSFTTQYGCNSIDSIPLIINPLPPTKLGQQSFCNNSPKFKLSGKGFPNMGGAAPQGETWAGNGVTKDAGFPGDWWFDPSTAGVGQHIITYTYKDDNGCSKSDTASYWVKPIPVIKMTKPAPVCNTSGIYNLWNITKTTPKDGYFSGTGVINDSMFDPALVLPTANIGAAPVTSWIYFDVDGNGCPVRDSVSIIVNPIPRVVAPDDRTICFDSLSWELPYRGDTSFVWTIDGNVDQDGYFSPGTIGEGGVGRHELIMYYRDPFTGCTNNDTMYLTVQDTPWIQIIPSKPLCAGEPVVVQCTYANAGGVQWSSATGGVFTAPNDTITTYYPTPTDITNGYFFLTVSTTGNGVCNLDLDTLTYTIYPIPQPMFTAPAQGCSPVTVNFNGYTLNNLPNCQYLWDFGDTSSGVLNQDTGMNPSHVFINNTGETQIYDVTLTVITPEGCDSTIVLDSFVKVFHNPVADFEPKPRKATVALPRIRFANLSTKVTDSTKYYWNFGDMAGGTSTDKNPSYWYTNTDTGTYIVTMTATTENGCVDTTQQEVKIGPEMTVFIPNAFTPDNMGIRANNFFWVEADNYSEFEIFIFNRWGEQVFYSKDRLPGWDGTYEGKPAQEDVYVYQVNIANLEGKWFKFSGTVTLLR